MQTSLLHIFVAIFNNEDLLVFHAGQSTFYLYIPECISYRSCYFFYRSSSPKEAKDEKRLKYAFVALFTSVLLLY